MDVNVDDSTKTTNQTSKSKRKKKLTDDWEPKESHQKLFDHYELSERGTTLEEQAMAFRDHWIGVGETRADWDRSFNTWLRKARDWNKKESTAKTITDNGGYQDLMELTK